MPRKCTQKLLLSGRLASRASWPPQLGCILVTRAGGTSRWAKQKEEAGSWWPFSNCPFHLQNQSSQDLTCPSNALLAHVSPSCTLGSLLANWLPYWPIWWLLHTSDILLTKLTSSWSDYNISNVSLIHLMSYLLIWCPAILFDIFTGLSVDPLFHLCPACLFKFYLPFFENVLFLFPWPVFAETTDKAHHYLGIHISVVIPSSLSVSV